MKKVIILLSALMICPVANAFDVAPPASAINAIQTLQGSRMHDMESINQQRFKHEEINEAKDIKEQKEKKNREMETFINDQTDRKIIKQLPAQPQVEFTEENGQIKIQELNK